MARPRGGDWLADELQGPSIAGMDVLVNLLSDAEVGDLAFTDRLRSGCRWSNLVVKGRAHMWTLVG